MKHLHRGRCKSTNECWKGTGSQPEPIPKPSYNLEPDPTLCKACGRVKDKPTMFCGAESHGNRLGQ